VREHGQQITAGIVTAVVGFASTFALVLAGLQEVGASDDQATSGLLVLCLAIGACSIGLSLRTRMPVTVAWSTPGAALLLGTGGVEGGFPAAVGAFLLAGALTVVAGSSKTLERWVAAIPVSLANAMLAGVLLPVCLLPVRAVVDLPAEAAGPVALWALLLVFARRWAVPAALVATVVVIVVAYSPDVGSFAAVAPTLDFTAPAFELATLLGLGVPLFLVTMASQNIPGMGVLASFGYRPPLRPALLATGAASIAGAPFGGHAVNLAAISAALAAGPEAGPDPSRRWIAAAASGACMLVLGLSAGLATILIAAAPEVLIGAVAGLALLGALAGALCRVLTDSDCASRLVGAGDLRAEELSMGRLAERYLELYARIA